ncbi:MAG: hypothetical protein ACJAZ9_001091 [Neolewinella sp.]|jgi:hypothetical protein
MVRPDSAQTKLGDISLSDCADKEQEKNKQAIKYRMVDGFVATNIGPDGLC